MNLDKLTPAPWKLFGHEKTVLYVCGPETVVVAELDGLKRDDTEFICLARNAFAVMMRRGWYAVPDSEKWFIFGEGSSVLSAAGIYGPWPDPFTAMIETDRWMKEQGL